MKKRSSGSQVEMPYILELGYVTAAQNLYKPGHFAIGVYIVQMEQYCVELI